MHCAQFDRSAYMRFGDDDYSILQTIAQRYMDANPVTSFTYRVSSANGIKRDLDYRYDMEMISRFPEMRKGEYVYAHAKLWSHDEQELPFSLSCYGPVTIYVNGKEAYQANIEEEVFPQRRSWFRLKLQQGWNYFVWQFMRTGTGCGAKFGSGSIKGFPLHFIVPFGEAEGAEGILFTSPISERRRQYSDPQVLQEDIRLQWHPKMNWSPEERKQKLAVRLFGQKQAVGAILAWTSVYAEQQGKYKLSIKFDGKIVIYCNGEQVRREQKQPEATGEKSIDDKLIGEKSTGEKLIGEKSIDEKSIGEQQINEGLILKAAERDSLTSNLRQVELELQQGANHLWFWLLEQDKAYAAGNIEWISLQSEGKDKVFLKPQQPIPIEGYKGAFLYSGPYVQPLAAEEVRLLTQMYQLHRAADHYSYWRVDMPNGFVRPFAEQTHFGRWNYPLGVTLYGLLRLEDETAADYAIKHIESCTAFHQYAHWDAEQFGAPGINHQLVGMDSLDDCGSFGATMLYGHSVHKVRGAEKLAADIGLYISSKQSRLSDGTLYRIKGSTDFMKDTIWCDDLYMSVPFLLRYWLLSNDDHYLNDAIHQLLQYKKYLFEPKLSIMHHVYDLKFNTTNGAYWGRGNGWVLFSLAELLCYVPQEHDEYDTLLQMYRELSRGYLALQGKNGLWHQVLDDHESYEESSCTSMFAYAFALGVQHRWFVDDLPYIASVERAWSGLKQRAIDEQGHVYGVCRGSGFAHHSYYYKHDLMPRLNDTHGIGIIMLAGIEAIKLKQWLVEKKQTGREAVQSEAEVLQTGVEAVQAEGKGATQ